MYRLYTNPSQHKAGLYQRVGTHWSETCRPKDESFKGRVDQGTDLPREAIFTGRFVRRTEHPTLFVRGQTGRG